MTAKTGWRRWFGGWLGVCALVLTVLPVPRSSAWDFVYGDPGPSNYSRYQDVAMGPDGSAYVAGFFFGSFYGLSSTDTYSYFLQKLGPTGAVEWTKNLGGSALSPSVVPRPPVVTTDGIGNVVVRRPDDGHLDSWSSVGVLLGTSAGLAGAPARTALGGFLAVRGASIERLAPDLSTLWTRDVSEYFDFRGAPHPILVTESDNGAIWVLGAKRRAVVTGSDSLSMVRLSSDGEVVTTIKHFGFTSPYVPSFMPEYQPLFSAVDGFVWVATPAAANDLSAGANASVRSFSTTDGSVLGQVPSQFPDTPLSSTAGPRNCAGQWLIGASPPTPGQPKEGVIDIRLTMNGTRLVVLAGCPTPGFNASNPRTFLLTYSVPNPSGAGMTLLSAKEMSSTANIVAMDANAYGDIVVVGSTTDGSVYVGLPSTASVGGGLPSRDVTAQAVVERAVAAQNPSGSLHYGIRKAGTVMELKVVGRNGVPLDAEAVALNVTSTGTTKAGYLTVYPCGRPTPPTSSLNFTAAKTRSNAVISEIGVGGKVCVFASTDTHVVVDVSGYFANGSPYVPLSPARLLESRTFAATTVDGQYWKIGERVANTVTEMVVAGRAGVPADAVAAVLSVTAVTPKGTGTLKVFPCGSAVPGPSHLPLALSQTVATTVITGLGAGGKVCFLPTVATHLVVDVQGYFGAGSGFTPVAGAKLADTSTAATATATVDGQFGKLGRRLANSTTAIPVAGRGGIAADAESVSLKITVSGSTANGYLNVYPCGSPAPFTAMMTYTTGATVTNTVLAKVGSLGSVCVFTSAAAHFVLDGHGYFAPGGSSLRAQVPERVVDSRSR